MKILILILFANLSILAQSNLSSSFIEMREDLKLIPANTETELMSNSESGKKNIALAILYSALLPGMGELYSGNYESGKYFTMADGLFWTAFAGFSIYGNWQENNYKSYAGTYGSVSALNKDDEFYATIGSYLSVDEFNRLKELDRNFEAVYNPSTNYWKWSNQNQRKEYREMWISSEESYNNIRFAVGALILNRLASIINAVRLVAKHNSGVKDGDNLRISFGLQNNQSLPPSLTFYLNAPL